MPFANLKDVVAVMDLRLEDKWRDQMRKPLYNF